MKQIGLSNRHVRDSEGIAVLAETLSFADILHADEDTTGGFAGFLGNMEVPSRATMALRCPSFHFCSPDSSTPLQQEQEDFLKAHNGLVT